MLDWTVPLIRVSDMIGFDSEIRLGASARAEQTLDSAYYSLSFFGPPIIDDDNFARTLLSKSLFNIVSSKRLPNMSTKEGECPAMPISLTPTFKVWSWLRRTVFSCWMPSQTGQTVNRNRSKVWERDSGLCPKLTVVITK